MFYQRQTSVLIISLGSLVTLERISLILLVGSLEVNPLAVKLLDNRLYMSPNPNLKIVYFSLFTLKENVNNRFLE